MSWLFVLSCSNSEFEVEHKVFAEYSALKTHTVDEEYYNSLLLMHQQYPESRALLEELLLFELEGSPDVFQRGFSRVQQYLNRHPGDGIFRIHYVKFLLTRGHELEALDELRLVLHNGVVHPWALAQDDFFQQDKYLPIVDKVIPVQGMQILNVNMPNAILVGQTALWELEVMHLSTCSLHLPAQYSQNNVSLVKLHRSTTTIDDVVQKSQLQLTWKGKLTGKLIPWNLQVKCGKHSIEYSIPSLTVVDVDIQEGAQKSSNTPMFWFPTYEKQHPSRTSDGVPLIEYLNEFRTKTEIVEIPQVLDEIE